MTRKAVALLWLVIVLPVASAHAAPPTVDSVAESSPRQLDVNWSLPGGMHNYAIEVATDPATVLDGDAKGEFLAENRVAYGFLLGSPRTTWRTPNHLQPGRHWVHVGAFDPLTCASPLGLGCEKEYSTPVPFDVWRPVVSIGAVGQSKRFLTARWGSAFWIHRTFIEVAVSPATYASGSSKGRFLEHNRVILDAPSYFDYQSTRKLPGGRYWVLVGGYDRDTCADPIVAVCVPEVSPPTEVVIKPDPPLLAGAWHDSGRPQAVWTLPSDMFVDFIEIANSPAVYPDGPFAGEFLEENTVLFDDSLDFRQTTYEGTDALPPGSYYVHVGGFVSSFCPTFDAITCIDEFSAIKQFTIPNPPVASGAGAPAPPEDSTAFAALRVRSIQSIRRLVVTAAMPERGTLSAYGTVSISRPKRVFRLRPASTPARAGVAVRLRLALPKQSLKAVLRALRRGGKASAKLRILARDPAGYMKTERRTIRLRR